MATLFTAHQAKITLTVPGVALGSQSWDKFSGAGRTADTQFYNPGGMAPGVATSGVTKRAQATLERAYDSTLVGLYKKLDAAVGSSCRVGVQPLSAPGKTAGPSRSYTGILREVNPPENDSTSSTVSMLQVVIELNEQIA